MWQSIDDGVIRSGHHRNLGQGRRNARTRGSSGTATRALVDFPPTTSTSSADPPSSPSFPLSPSLTGPTCPSSFFDVPRPLRRIRLSPIKCAPRLLFAGVVPSVRCVVASRPHCRLVLLLCRRLSSVDERLLRLQGGLWQTGKVPVADGCRRAAAQAQARGHPRAGRPLSPDLGLALRRPPTKGRADEDDGTLPSLPRSFRGAQPRQVRLADCWVPDSLLRGALPRR